MRLVIAVALAAVSLAPADLSPETLKSFERYAAAAERRIATEREGRTPLFWIDRQPEKSRAAAWARLRRGEAVVAQVTTRGGDGRELEIVNGRVHHWVATVLLPGVSIDRLTAFLRDYSSYPRAFAPLMTRAKVVERSADRDIVALRTSVKKLINVVMDGDYVMEYRRLGPSRLVTTTIATNLHQVQNEGRADERRQPTDRTGGYLWRYRMYCAAEERPEGLIDQCESLTLTRTVPMLVGWLVGGSVAAIPRDSLLLMMNGSKAALK